MPSLRLVGLETVCIQQGRVLLFIKLDLLNVTPATLSYMIPQTFWRMGREECLPWSPVLSFLSHNLLCILSLGKGRGKKINFITPPQGYNSSLEFSNLHSAALQCCCLVEWKGSPVIPGSGNSHVALVWCCDLCSFLNGAMDLLVPNRAHLPGVFGPRVEGLCKPENFRNMSSLM